MWFEFYHCTVSVPDTHKFYFPMEASSYSMATCLLRINTRHRSPEGKFAFQVFLADRGKQHTKLAEVYEIIIMEEINE